MPYTLAHPAAVLPLVRRGPLVTSGLVAGSMAPDVPYFAGALVPRAFAFGQYTHRLLGVCTVDVLLAAGLVALWRLVREPVLRLLPDAYGGRVAALTRPAGRPHPGWFCVSAALGSLTHVLWDDFTHPGRLGERLLPVLGRPVAGHPLVQLLQWASSAVALAALAWWGVRLLRRTGPVPTVQAGPAAPLAGRGVVRLLAVLALGWAAAAAIRHDLAAGYRSPLDFVPDLLFWTGAAAVCWAAGYAVTLRVTAMISASAGAVRMRKRDGEPWSGDPQPGRHDTAPDRTAV